MRLDVVNPCRLEPGMVVAGLVRLDAPMMPVQPMAAALTIERIEPALAGDGKTKGFFIIWQRLGASPWYPLYGPDLSFLVISGVRG